MKIEHAILRAVHGAFDRPRSVDESMLDPDALIAVGAGYAALTRDGLPVFEAEFGELEHQMTVREASRMAAEDAAHEWCIHLVGQADDRHYRRAPDGRWELYSRGYGLS
ncbi:MAG TPA: hypothetical protein VLD36_24045 [Burkholderiales bacterium]|nr:hypothetical protein [Burkholderiales bacterium]